MLVAALVFAGVYGIMYVNTNSINAAQIKNLQSDFSSFEKDLTERVFESNAALLKATAELEHCTHVTKGGFQELLVATSELSQKTEMLQQSALSAVQEQVLGTVSSVFLEETKAQTSLLLEKFGIFTQVTTRVLANCQKQLLEQNGSNTELAMSLLKDCHSSVSGIVELLHNYITVLESTAVGSSRAVEVVTDIAQEIAKTGGGL